VSTADLATLHFTLYVARLSTTKPATVSNFFITSNNNKNNNNNNNNGNNTHDHCDGHFSRITW